MIGIEKMQHFDSLQILRLTRCRSSQLLFSAEYRTGNISHLSSLRERQTTQKVNMVSDVHFNCFLFVL